MLPGMTALLTSFFLVGIAEMADKTQLLTVCLACRYPARKVLLGVSLAIAALNLAAVLVGGAAGALLPLRPIKVAAGLLFLTFGFWMLRPETTQPDAGPAPNPGTARAGTAQAGDAGSGSGSGRGAVATVAAAFLVAEVGDKTQLATLSLAASFGALAAVWLGATLGMLAANGLAIGGGTLLGARLPEMALERISALLFIVVGLWTLAGTLL